MIAVDTSALAAVILQEADRPLFLSYLATTSGLCVSAPTLLELQIVIFSKLGSGAGTEIRKLLDEARIDVVDFTEAHATIAATAWRRYGRGSGSPAKLNFGDCFSYALARSLDVPLLFKGDDFAATDVTVAFSA
ncbi:type II toxin-antitoxin system VapC family toxin [Jiella sonneratiae]|uniref:Ribonuclease VapC n=1 Tax=Jiella sonneratiae TaxID=2816856 RepID=A0ABS3J665_9HYPH|nr:type II toxin-antitoxin system VapC family toxin [Jiella sonneratiae]MBO0905145.1 type II toxin-antitoxin system VapC family toxin [Jiella sonneratiae]